MLKNKIMIFSLLFNHNFLLSTITKVNIQITLIPYQGENINKFSACFFGRVTKILSYPDLWRKLNNIKICSMKKT